MPRRSLSNLHHPSGLFFETPEQRASLARERFFEEGVRPSGLVPETVIQSWSRCVTARRRPQESVAFEPLTKTRIATELQRNRLLLGAAREDLRLLDAAIGGTSVKAMLTSRDGVVIYATPAANHEGRLMASVARVGVDLGELSVGTGAPGVAARTGEVALVRGGEHFFSCMGQLHCAAAPIRGAGGEVVGVLDLSSYSEMFRFDAKAMVKLYATAIEKRLLVAQARSHLLLQFQSNLDLFQTPFVGLAAIQGDGHVAWLNDTAASLLGCDRIPGTNVHAEELFGVNLERLLALTQSGRAQTLRLPSGLTLWFEAQIEGSRIAKAKLASAVLALPPPQPKPNPPSPTLRAVNRNLIESTLVECRGNLSRTARRLGVSRGLLYRRLREWGLL